MFTYAQCTITPIPIGGEDKAEKYILLRRNLISRHQIGSEEAMQPCIGRLPPDICLLINVLLNSIAIIQREGASLMQLWPRCCVDKYPSSPRLCSQSRSSQRS